MDPLTLIGQTVDAGATGLDIATDSAGPDRVGDRLLATGLKVVDVLAPLVRGGTAELVGPQGCGQLVVLSELLRRWSDRDGTVGVIVGIEDTTNWNLGPALWTDADTGVAGRAIFVQARGDGTDEARAAIETARTLAASLAGAGRDVLLAVDRNLVVEADVRRDALAAAGLSDRSAVTVIISAPHTAGKPRSVRTTTSTPASCSRRGWPHAAGIRRSRRARRAPG